MLYDSVCEAVAKIRRTTESSDPFRVCKEKGILVLPQSLGLEADAIKGFYYTRRRIKTITINSDLPDVIQRIIVAHELGHACLHAGSGINEFHDIGLFDESSIKEKEANLFAAEFLLDDDEVLDVLNGDSTFFSAASQLYVPAELLDFKFRVMKWKGYKLIEPPVDVHNNFLKDIPIPTNYDY